MCQLRCGRIERISSTVFSSSAAVIGPEAASSPRPQDLDYSVPIVLKQDKSGRIMSGRVWNPTILNRLTQLIRGLLVARSEQTSAADRGRERVRRMVLTAVTSAAAQIIKLVAPLVTVPIALNYLGEARFGLWMTVSSTLLMLSFSDLGLGNSLITTVAKAAGRDDRPSAQRLVSSAAGMLLAVAVSLAVLTLALGPLLDWSRLFNSKSAVTASETQHLVIVAMLCFAAGLPLGIVQKVQAAYQEGFQSNLWQCASSLLAMTALLAAVHWRLSLPFLLLGVMGMPLLVLAANVAFYIRWYRPWLRPQLSLFDMPTARSLLRTGLGFLVISILTTISYQCDNLILARTLGLDAVTQYSIPARLVALLNVLPMMIYQPFWPAAGEALTRGDGTWVLRQVVRIQRLTVSLTFAGAVVFALLGPAAIRWWLGGQITTPFGLLTGLGASAVLLALAGPWFMVLNAAGHLRVQIRMFTFFAVACIPLKVVGARCLGIEAFPWAMVLCYSMIILPAARKAALTHLSSQTVKPPAI
jgi:O-antigen/teichoic acid export membrane protein